MISYRLTGQPASQLISFEILIPDVNEGVLLLQLPAWRPGRYELGNFSRNVFKVQAKDTEENQLEICKKTKESWAVTVPRTGAVIIRYDYYAALLNAGSTWVNEEQLYVNPVNCFLYAEGREDEACELKLYLPDKWRIATGLKGWDQPGYTLFAKDFDQLADSPFIASPDIQHHRFPVNELDVHLWFQGPCKPDFQLIENDFSKFILAQIRTFGDFPEKTYHFLFQITAYKSYHGVEHENSTVCMIGPSYQVFKESYEDFLGLSSHEFYHSWNIKKIRPVEMMPYDFTKENYYHTGYVAEGVTTYMGDMMLYRSGMFSQQQFFTCIQTWLNKHFHNYGRFNMPVADASFDLWVDGYEPGVPNRKTSIYNEGALIALLTDILIIQHSNGKQTLHDAMSYLYDVFAKKKKGYSQDDYLQVISRFAGDDTRPFFEKYVWGTTDFEPILKNAFEKMGLVLIQSPSPFLSERKFGFRLQEGSAKVSQIAPDSPVAKTGLKCGDTIIAVNNMSINANLNQWLDYFADEPLSILTQLADNRIRSFHLQSIDREFFPLYSVKAASQPTPEQLMYFESWTKNPLILP
ncbi:MAG: PDZ domain-containing protein [Flavobacteriales bacterium]|nr:PDZ domain-containing protein [Flavobacteriales bacterium]